MAEVERGRKGLESAERRTTRKIKDLTVVDMSMLDGGSNLELWERMMEMGTQLACRGCRAFCRGAAAHGEYYESPSSLPRLNSPVETGINESSNDTPRRPC